MIDLGKWLDGSYTIPGEPATDEDLDRALDEEPESGKTPHRRH